MNIVFLSRLVQVQLENKVGPPSAFASLRIWTLFSLPSSCMRRRDMLFTCFRETSTALDDIVTSVCHGFTPSTMEEDVRVEKVRGRA